MDPRPFGRRVYRIPRLRFDRSLLTVVLGLTVLFTILDPPAGSALSLPATALFWFLHIGVGMLMAVLATALLARWMPGQPPHRAAFLILTGGILGSLCFAPWALAIESLWSVEPAAADADDWLDDWENRGGIFALGAEWLSLLPPYLSSWMLIHALPVGMQRAFPERIPESGSAPLPPMPLVSARPAEPSPPPASPEDRSPQTLSPTLIDAATAAGGSSFLATLPPAIGDDLVAIQADLHYLHVRTTRGRAMVLASLATAEQALGDRGLRVHRSHWVALAHVRRLARTVSGTVLVLSDGSRIPVSRRRAGEVRERLGHSFVVEGD
ncbi:MAG: LytTR family transcriptional regulator [Xanthomonadales bacterium]|nr:LytTR family transcriptional regulator [Xanthomonadales bacterium]